MPATQNTIIDTIEFDNQYLSIIEHEEKPWVTSKDLALALGYARADNISRIYDRNKDEFNDALSLTVKLTVNGNLGGYRKVPTRIFSPRGCHLVAMFARTEKAKLFRKWVLDVLEHYQFGDGHGAPVYENDVPHSLDGHQPDIFPLQFNGIDVPFTYYKGRFWLNNFNLSQLIGIKGKHPGKRVTELWRKNQLDMPEDGSRLLTWSRIGRTSGERVFDLPTCQAIAMKANYTDYGLAVNLWLHGLSEQLLKNNHKNLLPMDLNFVHQAKALNNLLGDYEMGDKAHIHALINDLLTITNH